jgi:hypothetical protein
MKTATIATLSLVCILLAATAVSAGVIQSDSSRLANTDLTVNFSMPQETASAGATPAPLAVGVSTPSAIAIVAGAALVMLALAWASWFFFADRILPVVRWSHHAGTPARNKAETKQSVVKFDSSSRKAA